MYAEDDSMTVMEVQEKLENNGYEVIVAYDGNEALEKFIACKPDLIVLDVDMPGKDVLNMTYIMFHSFIISSALFFSYFIRSAPTTIFLHQLRFEHKKRTKPPFLRIQKQICYKFVSILF